MQEISFGIEISIYVERHLGAVQKVTQKRMNVHIHCIVMRNCNSVVCFGKYIISHQAYTCIRYHAVRAAVVCILISTVMNKYSLERSQLNNHQTTTTKADIRLHICIEVHSYRSYITTRLSRFVVCAYIVKIASSLHFLKIPQWCIQMLDYHASRLDISVLG